MYPVHHVPAGDVLPIFFDTYDGSSGASLTMTGLAVTDIEIYKDGSATQRSSDAGYTLLDTDGIDFDGVTGIHGFSIDTGDNTDSGFYTVGAWFHVVVSAITVDGETVNFVAAAFRLMPAETSAGVPIVQANRTDTLIKNTASQRVIFRMFDVATYQPLLGLVNADFLVKTVALDTAAPSTIAGSVTEIGGGYYYVNLSQAETNATDLAFAFEASGVSTNTGFTVRTLG